MNKTSYLNHIQGLRAIAVIFVIFYHLTKNFSFGYVGVDIFFVISGFVISKSIYENLNSMLNSSPTGDKTEVQKFLWESEIIQPYLGFDFLNEGVVFTWKGNRYKITGAFTPINKINGFKLYKSNKIKFNKGA